MSLNGSVIALLYIFCKFLYVKDSYKMEPSKVDGQINCGQSGFSVCLKKLVNTIKTQSYETNTRYLGGPFVLWYLLSI